MEMRRALMPLTRGRATGTTCSSPSGPPLAPTGCGWLPVDTQLLPFSLCKPASIDVGLWLGLSRNLAAWGHAADGTLAVFVQRLGEDKHEIHSSGGGSCLLRPGDQRLARADVYAPYITTAEMLAQSFLQWKSRWALTRSQASLALQQHIHDVGGS